jgi:hypothetical protein
MYPCTETSGGYLDFFRKYIHGMGPRLVLPKSRAACVDIAQHKQSPNLFEENGGCLLYILKREFRCICRVEWSGRVDTPI